MVRLAKLSALAATSLAVAGCSGGGDKGGGGGGGEPPIADAGFGGEARLHQPFSLDGSGSVDPEGKPLSYQWYVLSTPEGSAVTLSSGGVVAQPSFVPDVPGDFRFGLLVSDGRNTSDLDTVDVRAELQVAVFGAPEIATRLADHLVTTYDVGATIWPVAPDSEILGASGSWLLYRDVRNGTPTLVAHDTESTLGGLTIASGDIYTAFIDGTRVVWAEVREGQWDLFANDLETGIESRLTDSLLNESLRSVAGGWAFWTEFDPDAGFDVFGVDLETGMTVAFDTAASELDPVTDGTSVVFRSNNDVVHHLLGGTSNVIATGTNPLPWGVEGDYAAYMLGTELRTHELTTGSSFLLTSAGGDFVREMDGDYVVYPDFGTNELRLWRHSTRASSPIVPLAEWSGGIDLSGTTLLWTQNSEVWRRTLPAGAPTQVTATDFEYEVRVAIASTGIAWDSDDLRSRDVYFSDDGGATATLVSTGKLYLDDAVDEYDVLLYTGYHSRIGSYGGEVLDAAQSIGLPILAADGIDGFGVAEGLQDADQIGLEIAYGDDCGSARIGATLHPIFAGWPTGAVVQLDGTQPTYDVDAKAFLTGGEGDLPADFEVLTYYEPFSCSDLVGEAAVVTFTSAGGSRVLLDGVNADDALPFWTENRGRLLYNGLLWLSSRP